MITNCICEHLNIDAITKLAEDITPTPNNITKYLQNANTNQTGKKIAIAADEAFTFQYGELDAVIKSMGAETIRFSPIHDRLPEADGYIFGGGYPELYSSELEANDTLRSAVYDMAVNDVPIYAECGGLMYLTRSISYPTDWRGHNAGSSYDMCGVFSGDAKIPEKKVLGYVTGTANLPCGQYSLRGHEFHYSTVTLDTGANFRYMLSRGKGIISGKDGVMVHHTLGAYTHLMPIIARRMLGNFFNLKNE